MFADCRWVRRSMAGLRHGAKKAYAFPVLLLPAGALLMASGGNRWEKTFQSIPNPRISIVNSTSGPVIVRGWDKLRVHVVCLTASSKVEVDADEVPANGEAEKLHLTTHLLDPRATPEEQVASYELDIPNGATLDVNNPQGSVTVQQLTGDAWINSVTGKISVVDASGRVTARSLSGDIELVRPSGSIEATSVMGNLRFMGSTSAMVRARALGSGNIFFDGDFVPTGSYLLGSYQGDMDITCPASDSFELRTHTVRGKVDDQMRLNRRGHPPRVTDQTFVHKQGDATVEVKSYSGTIHIRPSS